MPNIDALRVMLENDEISKRLIIITAIDERILRNAIAIKYTSMAKAKTTNNGSSKEESYAIDNIHSLITEYLDKLFICAIKLGSLTQSHKREYLAQLFENNVLEEIIQNSDTSPIDEEPQDEKTTIEGLQKSINKMTEQVSEIREILLGPEATNQSSKSVEWEKMSSLEARLIAERIDSWEDTTPRKTSIFYYRYLLCKNILIDKYISLKKENQWQDQQSIKAVLVLLLHFGNSHNPEAITNEIAKLTTMKQELIPQLPGLAECPSKQKEDYFLLLETMELTVAY